jgi:hypothetical protein
MRGVMDPTDNLPANRPEAAMGIRPESLYRIERYLTAKGVSEFAYDEKLDIFCFPEDGRFAFCDEFADWGLLSERGYL